MARKGLAQANTLRSNNTTSTGYGVVYADEVSGHRTVAELSDLYALHAWQLSASGVNTDNDAIGQLWYVVDADGKGNGDLYQLVNWEKRTEATGWKKFSSGAEVDLSNYVTNTELEGKDYATKTDATNIANTAIEGIGTIENTDIDKLWTDSTTA